MADDLSCRAHLDSAIFRIPSLATASGNHQSCAQPAEHGRFNDRHLSDSQQQQPRAAHEEKNESDGPVLGRRVFTDGRTAEFKQGWLSWIMSITTLTLYTAWIPLVILLILFAWNKYVALVVLSLFSTLLLPAKLHWQPCLDGYMLKTWREYFNFSYLVEGGIDPKAKYILAEFPHGAFPLGPIISMSIISECLYHKYTNGVGASILFWIPGYYHFLTWMGGVPASRSNVLKLLRKGSVAVTVGGIAEMFIMKPREEHIYLKKRKGIVRIAVETGTSIIPVFHFGNTEILSFGPSWLKHISRSMRVSIGMMYGCFGLPIPRHKQIMMVCGKPVAPGPAMSPEDPKFKDQVDKVHQELVDAMSSLYARHAEDFGWDYQNRPLVIE